MEWGYKWGTWCTELHQSRRSTLQANINFWNTESSQSTSTFEQPTCRSERRYLCQRRWIPNTTKLPAAFNAEGSSGNKKRLKAWLQISLEGTFTSLAYELENVQPKPQNFKRGAGCKISRRMNKHSPERPSMAMSTLNDQSFKSKDAHQDPTRRDSGRFSNPRRNKLSLTVNTTDPFLQYCPCRQLPFQPTFYSGPTTLSTVQWTKTNKWIGNNWSRLSITAGISFLILNNECDLNLTQHQINNMAPYQHVPVIELFTISSEPSRPRKLYTKTQTIINLVAFCFLIFQSLFLSVPLSNV